MKGDIFLHVGLGRTGTKFLQYEFFPKIKDSNVILRENVGIWADIQPDKINIMSSERLISNIENVDFYKLTERLSRIYPQAKIILCLRERDSWLRSMYHRNIMSGGIHTYDEWFEKTKTINKLDFNQMINHLHECFKEIYIYSYEQFKADNKKSMSELCDFMQVKLPEDVKYERINFSYSPSMIKMVCKINKLLGEFYGTECFNDIQNNQRYGIMRYYYNGKKNNLFTDDEFLDFIDKGMHFEDHVKPGEKLITIRAATEKEIEILK